MTGATYPPSIVHVPLRRKRFFIRATVMNPKPVAQADRRSLRHWNQLAPGIERLEEVQLGIFAPFLRVLRIVRRLQNGKARTPFGTAELGGVVRPGASRLCFGRVGLKDDFLSLRRRHPDVEAAVPRLQPPAELQTLNERGQLDVKIDRPTRIGLRKDADADRFRHNRRFVIPFPNAFRGDLRQPGRVVHAGLPTGRAQMPRTANRSRTSPFHWTVAHDQFTARWCGWSFGSPR